MSSWRDRNSNDVSYSNLRHDRREPDSKTPSIAKDKSTVFTNIVSIAGAVMSAVSVITLSFSLGLSTGNNNILRASSLTTSKKPPLLSCRVDGSGAHTLIGKVGSTERPIMKITKGMEYFGEEYTPSSRCALIAIKTNNAINRGATGWQSTTSNGYPIICAAKMNKGSPECIHEDDGKIAIIATFKKGSDIGEFEEFFIPIVYEE